MPWIAAACALALAACSFDANYGGGHYKCSDGVCPSGLVCTAGTCVAPGTADARPVDARTYALTCADPEPIASAGGTFQGTTAGRANTITASCSASVMNGNDAVYRYDATSGDMLAISVTASYAASAYVIAPCAAAPSTPTCIGGSAAMAGSPINVTAATTGPLFIVVDGVNPALSGTYMLTVTH